MHAHNFPPGAAHLHSASSSFHFPSFLVFRCTSSFLSHLTLLPSFPRPLFYFFSIKRRDAAVLLAQPWPLMRR
ncbi:hypothetical protein E2C01_088766 [Portunus trituberculatus]|uniref:Uncharacterized protein n=1 Tax=Portunus trituberculatus TaxID=210409 RepID=A0A5B7J722_PORTR|nr:hypothetical protein [Portunus trituberculatus]